jgi:hypothetical protein
VLDEDVFDRSDEYFELDGIGIDEAEEDALESFVTLVLILLLLLEGKLQ